MVEINMIINDPGRDGPVIALAWASSSALERTLAVAMIPDDEMKVCPGAGGK
jgi:hypothetical protein